MTSSDVKELKPLAHSEFFLSKTLIWSPFLNFPDTFLIPAANKLFPDFKARLAPSSNYDSSFWSDRTNYPFFSGIKF